MDHGAIFVVNVFGWGWRNKGDAKEEIGSSWFYIYECRVGETEDDGGEKQRR